MAKYEHDSEFDDLMGVDLNSIDLDDIDIGAEERAGPNLVAQGGFFIALAAFVLWLPTSSFYHSTQNASWLFFVVCGGAIVLGLFGGRWLTAVLQRAAERWALRNKNQPTPDRSGPPSALSRWLALIITVGGIVAIVFGSTNRNVSGIWVALGAVAVGVNLGRWLLMQQHRPFKRRLKSVPMPPWMKWVSLGVMVVAALVILFSGLIFGQNSSSSSNDFSFGAVAFVIAIGAAIWLAKRFDEEEKRLRAKHQRKP